MQTYSTPLRSSKHLRALVSGMSLVELIVGIAISSVVLTVAFKMYGGVMHGFQHGMVNLQNFQEAHLVMAYLRRDFSTSCPFVAEEDGGQELRNTLRRPVDLVGEKNLGKNEKMFVSDHRIFFHRYLNEPLSTIGNPLVERVEYVFDPNQKTLTRKGREIKVFKGLRDIVFKCYLHEINAQVPVLWVKMLIDSNESEGNLKGKPLEITTTIASAFVADISNSKNWNYRAFHRTN